MRNPLKALWSKLALFQGRDHLLLSTIIMFLCGSHCFSQQPVRLLHLRKLSPTADALPRIGHPTPVQTRINRELKRLDAEAKGEVLGCRGESEAGDEMFYNRDVHVSSKGLRFLSFDVEVSVGCGGVHPYFTRFTLTYDLTTGQQVRWENFLTKANAHGLTTNPLNSLPIELTAVTSLLLEKLYVAGWKEQDDCVVGAVVNDEVRTRFFLSAAPEHSGLSVLPADLPSTAASCEYPVVLGKAAMTELGIPEDVQRDLFVPGDHL